MLVGLRLAGRPAPQEPAAVAFPHAFVDDEGVQARLAREPEKIVSLAPQHTETLFALGAGGGIVGVSGAETYPPEATALPEVMHDDGITPNVEAIAALSPDLVLASGMAGTQWKTALRGSGMVVATLDARSLDDALSDIETIGRLVGRPKEASELATELRRRVGAIAARVSSRPAPAVFFETFHPPLIGAGPEGFAGDLTRTAGGSIVAGIAGESVTWTAEQVAAADPAFYLAAAASAGSADEIRARPGFQAIPAVRDGRIAILEDELVLRPGPRIVLGLEAIAKVLHPDAF